MKLEFFVPMFVVTLWSVFSMIRALRWASSPKQVFENDHKSRQVVLFNALVSIMLSLGIVTYANNQLSVSVKMPAMAIGSIVTWQFISNVVIASYAWGSYDKTKKINYNDWRREFTRYVAIINVIVALSTTFGVDMLNTERLRKPLQ